MKKIIFTLEEIAEVSNVTVDQLKLDIKNKEVDVDNLVSLMLYTMTNYFRNKF